MRSRIARIIGWVLLAVSVGALQLGVVSAIPMLNASIQLCMLVSFLLAVYYSHGVGVASAVIGGYWLDLHSSLPFGFYTAAAVVGMFLCVVLRSRVLKQDASYARAIPVFIGTWAFWGVYILLVSADAAFSDYMVPERWYGLHMRIALVQSVVHTVVVLAVFYARRLLGRRFFNIGAKQV